MRLNSSRQLDAATNGVVLVSQSANRNTVELALRVFGVLALHVFECLTQGGEHARNLTLCSGFVENRCVLVERKNCPLRRLEINGSSTD
jgi:hypothetical protein